MRAAIAALALVFWTLLIAEKLRAARSRRALSHVVHVNGTRGKSTVTRLIDAGLRAGGLRVLSKTTGTDPMTIGVDNVERAVRRIGPPNIREQLNILNLAAREKADVLVVECMAVDPALQRASQEKMLLADIGVITNVRRDHEDAMGNAPEEICDALSNTIPRGGVLLSAERDLAARLRDNCALRGCRFVQALPRGDEPDFEFAENLSLALAVCEELGVARETALDGMRRFRPDPYALSAYRWGEGIFINGFSANDPASIQLAYGRARAMLNLGDGAPTLIVNNRFDRGRRTLDMLKLVSDMRPTRALAAGASRGFFARRLRKALPDADIEMLRSAREVERYRPRAGEVVYAVGNLAGFGRDAVAAAAREGERIV